MQKNAAEVTVKQEKMDGEDCYYAKGDNSITLLGSMQTVDGGKKGKKRKAADQGVNDEKKQRLLEQEKVGFWIK